MALEVLVLANDSTGRRDPGVIVDVNECADGTSFAWGPGEAPPTFNVLHFEGLTLKTVDPRWLEYGYGASRITFNLDALSASDKAKLPLQRVLSLTVGRARAIAVDGGPAWMPQVGVE